MRPSTWRLDDLRSVILNLGYVGENLHTRIIIDCKKMFDQYPNASVSMTVTPPEGEPYPGLIERDGDLVIWDVRDSDLVAEGDGEIQLVFTQEPHIARSYNARTHVCRSQVPTGDVPSGLDDFVTRADQLLDQVEDTFPAGGTTGQVLAKKSGADYDTEWTDMGGGTEDYDELENRPQIGGVTLTGNKTLHDLGAASEADVEAKYTKPETGIPASDLAAGVIPDPEDLIDDEAGSGDTDKVWSADKSHALLTEINSKYTKPNTGIPASDMAEGVIPDISGKADKTVTDALQKDKAPVIIDSAEGNPIALTDGADGLPAVGMKIHFLPKQDTSGGDPSPSHDCPISGWQGLTAWRTGKNVYPIAIGEDFFTNNGGATHSNDNGALVINTNASSSASGVYITSRSEIAEILKSFTPPFVVSLDIVASASGSVRFIACGVGATAETVGTTKVRLSRVVTDTSASKNFNIYGVNNGATLTVTNLQIESGSTASEYAEYTGQSYPVTFPDGETIYDGTYDAVTGVLTADMAYRQLMSANLGNYDSGYSSSTTASGGRPIVWFRNVFNTVGVKQRKPGGIKAYCNAFPIIFNSTNINASQNRCAFIVDGVSIDSVEDFVSAVQNLETNGDGLWIAYELATPIEIQLDPMSVQTLLGDNVIWSDANGQIDLEYRADTKLWISGHSITVDSALSDTSENPVQKKVIKTALDGKEPLHNTTTVSGATPTITGMENTRYICGECSTLTITAPASGCIDVIFESGSTPTVLTVTSAKTGVSAIKWANGFDPTALEANTTYEINILDGEFGVVGEWT